MSRWLVIFAFVFSCASLAAAQLASTNDARFEEAQSKATAGDIPGALMIYETLTQVYPDSHEAYARLGGMQLMDQRHTDAIKSFQRAITLGDKGARSFIGMGMAYLHIGQFGPARASFVEAQARGNAGQADIAGIIDWIDKRDGKATAHQIAR